ncbi:putative protein toll [Brachionus plicatilis]|uniref:Uncharacterized protein n=1 Tax=Brachionus plicatilis TaxID=10195 RepID=A0A3M7Q203_BRAPC|nr:putative protein toll [Brachionus plicatilis]
MFNTKLTCSANNCTSFESSRSNSSGFWTEVFVFNCFENTPANPVFPATFSSQPTKYNEIDLSPNVYTSIPIDQLCPFRFLLSLDLSFNSIKSAANAFRSLACLTSLESVNLANNQIASPVLASDFDDTFSSKLRSLNLTKNMIGYIQSRAFVKPDGSTRFPNLEYLGLAYNRLKDLDLLWPLTLPNLNLFIDIKFNNISSLTNEFNLTYNNEIFKYPMINNRKLDATTNSLQGFDDQNLLQYGLFDQQNLDEFLSKISNYDFRQANLVPTFICFCPSSGQLTLFWFRSISSSVDRSKPIFKLFCSNSPSVYVLDFPCGVSKQITKRTKNRSLVIGDQYSSLKICDQKINLKKK